MEDIGTGTPEARQPQNSPTIYWLYQPVRSIIHAFHIIVLVRVRSQCAVPLLGAQVKAITHASSHGLRNPTKLVVEQKLTQENLSQIIRRRRVRCLAACLLLSEQIRTTFNFTHAQLNCSRAFGTTVVHDNRSNSYTPVQYIRELLDFLLHCDATG